MTRKLFHLVVSDSQKEKMIKLPLGSTSRHVKLLHLA